MWVVNQSNKLPREAVDALSKVFSQAGWGSEQPHLVEGLELNDLQGVLPFHTIL